MANQITPDEQLSEEQELILSLFEQACGKTDENGVQRYNHSFISAYEQAQSYLVKWEIISEKDCEYV